ncbi:hypothetical protein [Cupriavidus agavae]|uniref:Uncharacterized protein n=1 Tax=Cupriavidus agavae TaxID=1001822 RepID=A0A4Q7R855_9BURK|nr:hypothetical protein [Cupriavidus agavae]RZT29041.1 hypothetical protein EV147_5138 [Cupriavidus agavae]
MSKTSIRVAHVAVPGTLSVLKLKTFLRSALAGEAAAGTEGEILLVKVLVPEPLGLKAGEAFFNKTLQQIVDKTPRVKRVSVEFVAGEITPEAIAASEARIRKELDAYGHLLQEPEDDAAR